MGTESTASTAVESLPQQRSSEGRPLVGASAAPAAAGAPAPSFSGSPPWAASISHLLPDQDDDEGPAARTKRPRVALACQRCKARKQKCDGRQPCGKCAPSNVRCEYVVPQKPMPFGKNQYIKSLERRVAELETLLARQGVAEVGTDHWKMATPPPLGFGDSGPAGVPAPAAPRSASSVVQTEAGGGGGGGSSGSPTTTGGDAAGGVAAPAKHPDEAVLDWQDGLDSVVSVLRSLSLDMDGSGYIGASSHVALGRLFNFLSRGSHHPARDPSVGGTRRPSSSFQLGGGGGGTASVAAPTTTPSGATPPALAAAAAAAEPMEPIDFADVPSNLADRLYVGYIKNVMTRFPVVHSVWLRAVHHRRHALTDVFEATILHLVYATSGRFIETTGESGPYHARRHYAAAMRELDTMLEYNDIRTVQALMLMAIYCLRDPAGPGAWTCSRMALLVAIDHGLHRQTKAAAQTRCLESELRKRLFWACYCFDRQISIPMGRPLGISDRDIDIALPLDVDEDITEHALAVIDLPTRTRPADPSTSLTSFVLIAELRRIESTIQETIYRVDRNAAPIDDAVIDGFLERLEHWKAQIPHDTKIVRDIPGFPYDGYYFYVRAQNRALLSAYLLAADVPDGLLLQGPAPPPLPRPLRLRRRAALPQGLRPGLRRHLRRLQAPAPDACRRLLVHGAAERLHCRPHPRLLHLALPQRHLRHDHQQRHPRLQHRALCHCRARARRHQVPQRL